MPLPRFKLERPQTLSEALQLLDELPDALPVAGGTDLLVSMKQGLYSPRQLVDLKAIEELNALEGGEDGLYIGACVKLATVRDHAIVKEHAAAVSEAAGLVASPNIQNMGTLGGNICLDTRCWYFNQSEFWRNSKGYCLKKDGAICQAAPSSKRCFAVFSSDTVPALIAVGARVKLARWNGNGIQRWDMPIEDLYRENGIERISLKHGDLVLGVHLPDVHGYRSGYLKYRKRGAIDYPLASVAVALRMVDGIMRDVRIVLGALASAPVIAVEAMEILEGESVSAERFTRASELIGKRTCPIRNQAGSPLHRKLMARRYCHRLLTQLTTQLSDLT